MKSTEKIKQNKLKFSIIISVVTILLLASSIGWNILTSEKGLKLVVLNSSNKKMMVELFIFAGPDAGNGLAVVHKTLEHNESDVFNLKFDQSDSVYQLLVEAINYSYWGTKFDDNSTVKKVDGYAFYRFPNGQIHDLLAIIIPSESNAQQDSNMNTSSTGYNTTGNTTSDVDELTSPMVGTVVDIILVRIPEADDAISVNF